MNFPDLASSLRRLSKPISILCVLGLLALSQRASFGRRIEIPQLELAVSLPVVAQLLLTGGDRYLAADIGFFRVLVAETVRMSKDDFRVQAKIQQDVAWLNPAHEDNYYVAAAILPWEGFVQESNAVLSAAASSRPTDWHPAFYLAFNRFHFDRDPAGGADWLLKGAERAVDQGDEWTLRELALRWIELGYRVDQASAMVSGMARSAPPGAFRKYLGKRAERLAILANLRTSLDIFKARFDRAPETLDELVSKRVIDRLPEDPLGQIFRLTETGEVVAVDPNKEKH